MPTTWAGELCYAIFCVVVFPLLGYLLFIREWIDDWKHKGHEKAKMRERNNAARESGLSCGQKMHTKYSSLHYDKTYWIKYSCVGFDYIGPAKYVGTVAKNRGGHLLALPSREAIVCDDIDLKQSKLLIYDV